ncbi:uncharacterized protein [Dendropsophus ebraccatus]|uniref:uncharacterized protein n=1 Tax=Dendropsophus ebraccatus TaxID=150705 RepID=UPI003831CA1F
MSYPEPLTVLPDREANYWLHGNGTKDEGVYLLIILVLSPGMSRTSKIICDHRFILVYVNRTRTMERMAVRRSLRARPQSYDKRGGDPSSTLLGAQCEDPKILVTPIIIPNVAVRVADWQNMTVAQQGNEVFSHLNLFMNATRHAKTPACMSQQLKQLTRSIRAVHGLVNKAWRQVNNDTDLAQEASFVPSVAASSNSSDILDIFHRFVKLLQGKVTLLLNTLCDVGDR